LRNRNQDGVSDVALVGVINPEILI
jgi:hypothetical protein